jgi:cytochrome c oxidase assembly protein subunit 15
MVHRLGALLLGIALAALYWRYRQVSRMKHALNTVLGIYLLQAGLGIANVLWWLPLWLALLHTAGATALTVSFLLAVWSSRHEYYDADVVTIHPTVKVVT